MGSLGLPEMIMIGLIALLVFGPKKLPELGSGLGKAIKDFKSAMNDNTPEAKPETPAAPAVEAKTETKEEAKQETHP